MVFTFDCPDCQSKTEFAEDVLQADVSATSTFVCPSCQTLYDVQQEENVIQNPNMIKPIISLKQEA